jgi:cytidine deaminase
VRVEIDWDVLRAAAVDAMRRAYAPYSRFPVGAAALVDDGRVVTGCNVENAGYGVTLCAECGVVSSLHATGGGRLVALACVDGAGAALMPCGRCRQLLWEHGGPACLIDAPDRPRSMAELLPFAFDVVDLADVPGASVPSTAAFRPAADTGVEVAVPARLLDRVGEGTVFVHTDVDAGRPVWTSYWERSSGVADEADTEEEHGIIEEGAYWTGAAGAVAWGLARTPRVVVVDADGVLAWAGTGPAPEAITEVWQP